ncbi:MAG: phage tail protein [Plesiomonas sp.]|uniref:phage tail protein n=1 Tax=Plesiomonas sp. TaxID=2486279 RepID=UPI003F414149
MADIIATKSNGKLFKGQLLTYYYNRRAESAIGQNGQFQIKKGYFGTSALVTQNPSGGWTIADIPLNFSNSDLLNKFSECNLICSVNGSTISLNATLPESELPEGEAFDFNTLALVDDKGNVFGVLCCQQDTLYKGKSFTALLTIEQKVA